MRRSSRAAEYTCRDASRFNPKMPRPTIRSGHAERVAAVTMPAAMIATFASASFLAERNVARVRLPLWVREAGETKGAVAVNRERAQTRERQGHRSRRNG